MLKIWNLQKLPYLYEMQYFPFPLDADSGDVIAVGGNLSPGLLLSAYRQGIFPWYNEGEEIYWWSPLQRFVLFPEELHLRKSLRKQARRKLSKSTMSTCPEFRLSIDSAFAQVITACAETARPGQQHSDGSAATWITDEMKAAYIDLHLRSYAHSVECWQSAESANDEATSEKLIGGFYGIALGQCFFGESMFHHVPEASKIAFAAFAAFLHYKGFRLIDCQQETAHLASFGARSLRRAEFLQELQTCNLEQELLAQAQRKALWQLYAKEFSNSSIFDEYLRNL